MEDLKKEQREIFLWDANSLGKQNLKDVIDISLMCLDVYVDVVMTFGFDNGLVKDVVNIWKEFIEIIKKEKRIFKFLVDNSDKEDYVAADDFITKLYILNDNNFNYYYEALENIKVACYMKMEWKAKRPIKTFDRLIESDEYYKELYGLIITMDDIKDYFNYSDEFWNFLKSRLFVVDSHEMSDNSFYGVNMKMVDDKLVDIKVIVPKIISLETALINVHDIKHAFDLYQLIGNNVNINDDKYEISASDSECKFKNEYMVKKLKKYI